MCLQWHCQTTVHKFWAANNKAHGYMAPDAAWARRSRLQAHVTQTVVVVCLQQTRALVGDGC